MGYQALTETILLSGSASMGAGTGLERTLVVIPTSSFLTSFLVRVRMNLGAGTSTYASYSSGEFLRNPDWTWGISWVKTGDTVPNIQSAPDDSHFLAVDYFSDSFIRQTINTAGSPTYQDLFGWVAERKGRCQVPTSPGGSTYFHIANNGSGTEATQWDVLARFSYNLIN
jgi:hypothetical protein